MLSRQIPSIIGLDRVNVERILPLVGEPRTRGPDYFFSQRVVNLEFFATDGCGDHHWVFLRRKLTDT